MVLIPKGRNEYKGIGLVEVMWKFVAAILHCRLMTAITYHDFLHCFLAGRGTGTATLEAKLLQQLAAMRGSPVPGLPGPDQVVRRLGQVQEPGDLGRVRGWATSKTDAAGLLGKVHDGGTGRGIR